MRGGQGGKVEVCMRTGELTPSPYLPVGGTKQVDKTKKLIADGGTEREVKVHPEITRFDRDTAGNGRTLVQAWSLGYSGRVLRHSWSRIWLGNIGKMLRGCHVIHVVHADSGPPFL